MRKPWIFIRPGFLNPAPTLGQASPAPRQRRSRGGRGLGFRDLGGKGFRVFGAVGFRVLGFRV